MKADERIEAMGRLFDDSDIKEMVKDLGTYEREPQDHWICWGLRWQRTGRN